MRYHMIIHRITRKIRRIYNFVRWGMPSRYGHLTNAARDKGVHRIMEIGTFNGVRASELLDEACKFSGPQQVEYYGFDMFEDLTQSQEEEEVVKSKVPPSIEVVRSRLARFSDRGVTIKLFKGDSTDVIPDVVNSLPEMDLIFVDGGHSYPTVKSDWNSIQSLCGRDTQVFFDDFVNERACKHDGYGINSVVGEIDRNEFNVEILEPCDRIPTDYGFMDSRIVRVVRQEPEGS